MLLCSEGTGLVQAGRDAAPNEIAVGASLVSVSALRPHEELQIVRLRRLILQTVVELAGGVRMRGHEVHIHVCLVQPRAVLLVHLPEMSLEGAASAPVVVAPVRSI